MVTNILKRSKNDDTKILYDLTSKNFVRNDAAINKKDHWKAVKSRYNNAVQNKIQQNLSNLKKQNNIMKHLQQVVPKYRLESWLKQIQNLPPNIFAFCRKALIFRVVNNSNLHQRKILNTPNFNVRDGKQTQLLILNNCPTAATEERYTWRHDSVLYTLTRYLRIRPVSRIRRLRSNLYVF